MYHSRNLMIFVISLCFAVAHSAYAETEISSRLLLMAGGFESEKPMSVENAEHNACIIHLDASEIEALKSLSSGARMSFKTIEGAPLKIRAVMYDDVHDEPYIFYLNRLNRKIYLRQGASVVGMTDASNFRAVSMGMFTRHIHGNIGLMCYFLAREKA